MRKFHENILNLLKKCKISAKIHQKRQTTALTPMVFAKIFAFFREKFNEVLTLIQTDGRFK